MILDQLSTFAKAVSLVGTTGTAKIGTAINVLDPRNIGIGNDIQLDIGIATAVDSAADGATVGFNLVTADNEALTTNAVVLMSIPAKAQSALAAGASVFSGRLPSTAIAKQWIGLQIVRGGEAVTAGTVNAHLTMVPRNWYGFEANTGNYSA